ncbi:FMN reductase [Streptomyces sp. 7-21]|uniref:FMN reductase n=1 Tax=Streptomyces sp. 7-21 TaxID=2802283 RepID=UPI00191EEE57|nr:FMN reductase [Streptomyces sp. 7-21]MBL1067178.1 FMN reductase [Streptomyces sp. 7-21]
MTAHETRLAVISAGLSQPSATRRLADRLAGAATKHLAEAGHPATARVIELRELATPIAHHLVTGFPGPPLREALDTVTGADGLIAVTPVFAGSYSGLFKSFFDLVEPGSLDGTPVLLAATGGSARHSLVLDHAMRPLFSYLRALTAPTGVYAAAEDWGGTGDSRTGPLPERIDRAARELASLVAGRPAGPRAPAEPEVVPFEEQLARVREGD